MTQDPKYDQYQDAQGHTINVPKRQPAEHETAPPVQAHQAAAPAVIPAGPPPEPEPLGYVAETPLEPVVPPAVEPDADPVQTPPVMIPPELGRRLLELAPKNAELRRKLGQAPIPRNVYRQAAAEGRLGDLMDEMYRQNLDLHVEHVLGGRENVEAHQQLVNMVPMGGEIGGPRQTEAQRTAQVLSGATSVDDALSRLVAASGGRPEPTTIPVLSEQQLHGYITNQ